MIKNTISLMPIHKASEANFPEEFGSGEDVDFPGTFRAVSQHQQCRPLLHGQPGGSEQVSERLAVSATASHSRPSRKIYRHHLSFRLLVSFCTYVCGSTYVKHLCCRGLKSSSVHLQLEVQGVVVWVLVL